MILYNLSTLLFVINWWCVGKKTALSQTMVCESICGVFKYAVCGWGFFLLCAKREKKNKFH